MKYLLAVFAAITAALIAFRAWRESLYSTMKPDALASMDVMFLLVTLAVVGCSVGLFAAGYLISHPKPRTEVYSRDDAPIDTQYRTLANYRAPLPALPAPQVITVPRYSEYGVTRPMNAPRAEVVLETTTATDEKMQVALRYLVRFAAMESVSRTNWQGSTTAYTSALRFFREHGLIEETSPNKYQWADAYTRDARRAWIMQFDQSPTRENVVAAAF